MARKSRRSSSGAPGIVNGPGIGPSLNPLGLSQGGANPLFLDITVAADYYRENSEWKRWHANAEAQALWAQPVQPRR